MSMEKNENDTVRSSEEPEINSDNNTGQKLASQPFSDLNYQTAFMYITIVILPSYMLITQTGFAGIEAIFNSGSLKQGSVVTILQKLAAIGTTD